MNLMEVGRRKKHRATDIEEKAFQQVGQGKSLEAESESQPQTHVNHNNLFEMIHRPTQKNLKI